MKKKILFLIPPSSEKLIMEKDKEVNDAFGTYAPLGLMYIATFLKQQKDIKNHVEVKIVDCSIGHWNKKRFQNMLVSLKPDMVGITVFTPSIIDTKNALQTIKKILPDCVTIIGGPHVSSFGADSLGIKEADYGIMGYGEYSFCQLVKAKYFGGKLNDIPGLVYREKKSVKVNKIDNNKIKIDDLPIPDRILVPYKQYRCPVGTREVMATLVSSRGCPFKCTFCNSPDKIYNARSMENVMEEIKYLAGIGIKEIFFYDDLFNLTNERVFEFCRRLKKNKIKITWAFKSRVVNVNEKLIQTVKKAGCERIHFGLETHTDEGLRQLKKGATVKQIRNAVKLCYKYKINSVGSFMINLPNDTRRSILERFKFANSLKLDYVQYGVLIAYNHSEIFDEGAKRGLWDKNLWRDYIKDPTPNFIPPLIDNGISRAELDKMVKKGLKSFYLRPQYIYQRIRNIHSWNEVKKYFHGALKLIKFS